MKIIQIVRSIPTLLRIMPPPRSPVSSPRVQPSSVVNDEKPSCVQCFGLSLVGCIVFGYFAAVIYNIIYSLIAIISITQREVENVCPNSELWWFALFLGVIWPLLGMNSAKSAAEKKGDNDANPVAVGACMAFIYLALFITYSVWAWDQLYGLSGFANDDCAMVHWQFKNTTEGANNDGHDLYSAVQLWMYLYMIGIAVIILAMCGLTSIIVIDSCQSKKSTSTTATTTNGYGAAAVGSDVANPPPGARRLTPQEAEDLRLQNLLATGNEHGATAESAV